VQARHSKDGEERTWAWFFSLPPAESQEEVRKRIASVSPIDRILSTAVLEAGLPGTLAALLGLLLGIQPLGSLRWDVHDLALALVTAAPLVAADVAVGWNRSHGDGEGNEGTQEEMRNQDTARFPSEMVEPSLWQGQIDELSFVEAARDYPRWYRNEFMLLDNLAAPAVLVTIAGAAFAQEAFYRGSILAGTMQWATDRLGEAGMLDAGSMSTLPGASELPTLAVMFGVVVTIFMEGYRFSLRVGHDGELEEELEAEDLEPYELRRCFEKAASSSSHECVLLAYDRMRRDSVGKGNIELFWQKVIYSASQLGLYDRVLRLVDEMEFSGGTRDAFISEKIALAAANTKRWKKAINLVEKEMEARHPISHTQRLALLYSCQQTGRWELALKAVDDMIQNNNFPHGLEDAAAWLSVLSWVLGLYHRAGEDDRAERIRKELDILLEEQNTYSVTYEVDNDDSSVWSPSILYSLRCFMYGLVCTGQWLTTGNLLAPVATRLVSESVLYLCIYHRPASRSSQPPS